jgi:opacity protein-like surface antigen
MLLFFSAAVVQAQDKPADTKGIYVGLIGGYVVKANMDTRLRDAAGGGPPDYNVSMTKGLFDNYLAGAKVGWLTPFTNRIMAVEFEYNHIQNKFDKETGWGPLADPTCDLDGKIQIDLFMLNVIARYPQGRFHPYIGAGAGYAYMKIDDMTFSLNGVPLFVNSGASKGGFAYQAMTGIDIDITKNIILGIAYKYLVTQKISYDSLYQVFSGPTIPVTIETDYRSHNFTLSLSYMF